MKKLSGILATILCILLLLGPLSIIKKYIFPKRSDLQENRIHLNTGNTTRLIGKTSEDIGIEVSKILYPSKNDKSKFQGIILMQSDKWQDILAVTPVIRKYKSTIITVNKEISPNILRYLKDSKLLGIPELNGTQLLVLGSDLNKIKEGLKSTRLNCTYVKYNNTNELQNIIYKLPNIKEGEKYGFLVKDNDPLISIPAATWIVNQGGILLYVDKNNKLYSTSENILKNNKLKDVYVLADKSLDGDGILKPFKVRNKRITAFNPESFAVKFAKFNDDKNYVGWDLDRKVNGNGHNYILCSKEKPTLAAMASTLALSGKSGPILWTSKDRLSPVTENYLWRVKPSYRRTSTEGPYNNVWIIGDDSILSYGVQGTVDYIEGNEPYNTMGQKGISGIEALAIISMLISVCGSIWITLHLFLRMRNLSLLTKLMWILTVLLLGPLGLWGYIISYINSPWMKVNNKVMWVRPVWKQSLVATVTGLSFAASFIISFAYIMNLLGLPLGILPERAGVYLLGNPMVIFIIISYILAFILDFYIFMPTFFVEMKDISYIHAKKESALVVLVSILSIFVGMVFTIWWCNMMYTPTWPEKNSILWWGFMQLSSVMGGIISYMPNWLLVKYGKRMGTA